MIIWHGAQALLCTIARSQDSEPPRMQGTQKDPLQRVCHSIEYLAVYAGEESPGTNTLALSQYYYGNL